MNRLLNGLFALVAVIPATLSQAQSLTQIMAEASESSSAPWEIGYVLFVAPAKNMREQKLDAQHLNAQMVSDKKLLYLDAKALLSPSRTIGKFAITSIRFTPQGRLIGSDAPLSLFTARRTKFNRMVFIKIKASKDRHLYHFADWHEEGLGYPALCTTDDADRYDRIASNSTDAGNFGCVEWAQQLYRTEQPYIDVTNYTDEGNFIGSFMGWSRFTDPPKPVIGLDGTTWMCLHNCPDGAKPGVIADIGAWSKKYKLLPPEQQGHGND